MKTRSDVKHTQGPFQGIQTGDVLRIFYDGASCAVVNVLGVRQHSIQCYEGDIQCKITKVSDNDIRFYATIGPGRESVLRPVAIRKIDLSGLMG